MNAFFLVLEDVFLKIFNMSLTAVWIILAVMLLRLVFKKGAENACLRAVDSCGGEACCSVFV